MNPPSTIFDIAEVVGPEVARWLCQHYPGQRIRIPCTIQRDHALAQVPMREKLTYHYGGIRLRIPPKSCQEVMARDLRIYADWRSGMSLSNLAKAYGISVRGVRRSLARAQAR